MVVKHSFDCHQLQLNALEEIHVVDPNQNSLALELQTAGMQVVTVTQMHRHTA